MYWSPPQRLRTQSNADAIATLTPGTAVTTGGAPSTKGSPTQLIAATDFDVWGVTLVFTDYGVGNTASDGCFDLLIGANDDVRIENILCGYSETSLHGGSQRIWFPLYIPAGTKVSGRAAGARVNAAMQVRCFLSGGTLSPPWRVGSRCTTYGITTVPHGTSVIPDNGSPGAWAEIASATTEQHMYLVPSFQLDNDPGTSRRVVVTNYGIGSAGSEVVLGSVNYSQIDSEMISTVGDYGLDVDVAAGTRLVMRASTNGAPDSYSGAIHGVT